MTDPPGERLLTRPLLAFLLLVAAIVGYSGFLRWRSPDLEGTIELLADGDLDGPERQQMLRHLIDLAGSAGSVRQRWAGLLAAVSVADRDAYAAFDQVLGQGSDRVLPPAEQRWLSLGDALLANLLQAMMAEAQGDPAAARPEWQQVAFEARLTGSALAAELAGQRLR